MTKKLKAFKIEENSWIRYKAYCLLNSTTPEIDLNKYIQSKIVDTPQVKGNEV
jgi:hypothetical protein